MTTRTPGKSGTRAGTKSGSTAGAKKGAKSKAPAGTKPGVKTSSRPKTAAKKTASTPKRKKTSRRKKESFLHRYKPYLLGLSLGLLIGCFGTLALFYFPEAIKLQPAVTRKPTASKQPVKTITAPSRTEKKSKPPLPAVHPAKTGSGKPAPLPYEEKHRLERQIKRLDQALFAAFYAMPIPDRDIHLRKVTPQRHNDQEWDHTSLEVQLSGNMSASDLVQRMAQHLEKPALQPPPTLITSHQNHIFTVEVRYNGLRTHTVRLLIPQAVPPATPPPPPPSLTGVRPKVAIVIDDLGMSRSQARCFLEIPFPVACSVPPFCPIPNMWRIWPTNEDFQSCCICRCSPPDGPRSTPVPVCCS